MPTLTRRRFVQAGTTTGALALWPTAVLLDRTSPAAILDPSGTTLATSVTRSGSGYRRLEESAGWRPVVREELAPARRGREDRRTGFAHVVQVSDLHVTDVQSPLRFEYIDRLNRTGHRPQELLTTRGAAALVRRINGLAGGPASGRPIDAVMSTGDNTDNQAGTELDWLLTVLAGGTVRPDSGAEAFEGVADSGLTEYWQPESPRRDRYKNAGFPHLPGLIAAATAPFDSPGLTVPWLLTMGNHDCVAGGMLENRPYVEAWSGGDRKVFSAQCDATLRLAALLREVKAFDDVGDLLESVAAAGHTRTVAADPRRMPYTGEQYVALLHEDRFTGAGPVGHGYTPDTTADRLYYSHEIAPGVTAISLDSTNQAGGIEGSIGAAQWDWLVGELDRLHDQYVLVFTHHPSDEMTNLAPDPRAPEEDRRSGAELVALLHRHPGVLAWVNGHTHHNRITPRRHRDPRYAFWEINSASHVDAPQQARLIEVVHNGDGTLSLFTTMIDADAPLRPDHDRLDDGDLAGLYRELAFNDPSYQDRSGSARDRNTELLLFDPLPA